MQQDFDRVDFWQEELQDRQYEHIYTTLIDKQNYWFLTTLTCIKYNYLCSHLQVKLSEANRIVMLFFYFSHMCASGSSASLGTLPSPFIGFDLMINFSGTRAIPSIGLIFQIPDQWNLIYLADFFKCQTDWIPLIWSLKFQKCSAPLHFKYELGWTVFLASGTPQQLISRGKNWKITFKILFFPTWKLMLLFGESPITHV